MASKPPGRRPRGARRTEPDNEDLQAAKLKNVIDALWVILRQQGDDPEMDILALVGCASLCLAALNPEIRRQWYAVFLAHFAEGPRQLMTGEIDADDFSFLAPEEQRH